MNDEEFDWDEFARALKEIEDAMDDLARDFGLQMAEYEEREILGENQPRKPSPSADSSIQKVPLTYPICLN